MLPELHEGGYSGALEKVSVWIFSIGDDPVVLVAPRNFADLAKHGFLLSAEKSAFFYPGEALREVVAGLQALTNAPNLENIVIEHNQLRRKAPGCELRSLR